MENIHFEKSDKPYILTQIHYEAVSGRFPTFYGEQFGVTPSAVGGFNRLTIVKGYRWNGPSGPTVDTKDFMRASLVHDCLYDAIEQGLIPKSLRHQADRELYRICREDGMPWFRAQYVYRAVRWFGGRHV